MRKRITPLFVALLTFCFLFLAVGCQSGEKEPVAEEPQTITATDLAGREVEIAGPVDKVVAIGPGALRLVCYANGSDKVVGVEQLEKDNPTGRPYGYVYPDLMNLPVIGPGGPDSSPDPEKLLNVQPDVIFATYIVDKAKADQLQEQIKIPVVVLSYGQLATFDENVYTSLSLIGKVIGGEQRAEEVVSYIKGYQADLQNRTKDIPDDQKLKVYAGAISAKGAHGIESTQGGYPPLAAINAVNVVDETGKKGSLMIDREKLLDWDPEIILIDEGGYALVKDDYAKNKQFYQSLSAVKNGNLYGLIPYNYYTTNLGTAIADAYYAGKVVYPEKFKDIDPVKKADEIYTNLLGKPVYDQMAKDFGGFKKLTLE